MGILDDLFDNRPKAWETTVYVDDIESISLTLTPEFGNLRTRSLKEAENEWKSLFANRRPNYEFNDIERNEELLILEGREWDGIYQLCTSPTYRIEIRYVDITKNEMEEFQITSQ